MQRREYLFVYDAFLGDPGWGRTIASMEAELASGDLRGRTVQVSALRSAKDAVHRAIQDEAAAVVVVGNDGTFANVLDEMMGTSVPLGFIPLAEPMGLARELGIPKGIEAVKILSARHLERIGYLAVNQKHVALVEVRCEGRGGKVMTEEGWSLGLNEPGEIVLRNPLRGQSELGMEISLQLFPPVERKWFWQKPEPFPPPVAAMHRTQVQIVGPGSGEWHILVDGRDIGLRASTVEYVPDALTVIAARPKLAKVETKNPE